MGARRRIRLLAVIRTNFVPADAKRTGPKYDVFTGDLRWFQDNIPCQAACPARTDVPRYIALIADGRYRDSDEVNREANVLPACLGRICARPCEDACRRRVVDAPVAICALKRVAADYGSLARLEPVVPPTGKRVAIVGAGPSGLAAARELARQGHQVTILERYPVPGGMLWVGVPEWRLPRDVIRSEVELITGLGVEIWYNVEVGRDVSLEELVDRFDAVLLAAGCQQPATLGIPGEELEGVLSGLRFLEGVNVYGSQGMLHSECVLTIGGGYVSLDCARTALRLGAVRSILAYRSGRDDMPVSQDEIAEAEREGVEFVFMATPTRIAGRAGRVAGVKFARNRLGDPDETGRRRIEPVPGSELVVPCDRVIVAIGQRPDRSLGQSSLFEHVDRHGAPQVDEQFRTGHPKIWATGDYVAGPRNVISAIADGKRAARSIDAALRPATASEPTTEIELVPLSTPEPCVLRRLLVGGVADWTLATPNRRLRHGDPYLQIQRQAVPSRPLDERGLGASLRPAPEVELPLSPVSAQAEARRCLQCQLNIFIDGTRCILCSGCVEACPQRCLEMVTADRIQAIDNDPARPRSVKEAFKPHAVVMVLDEERCIRCGACVDRCPTGCLTMEHFRAIAGGE